ncbi:MAG: TIGR04283 family arsenosugar biosynthesis glycosyltransferase [Acidobacteria bacterium]|nr:TIGR04283 family arsenosugar biosynthesis glycosyltransferase [Acidobacteriota bacterium]
MLSIIVPTYNEEKRIAKLLRQLRAQAPQGEIIMADGSSTDATAALAEPYARVVVSPANRGAQLNRGARAARGDALLFLHADVVFPEGGLAAVEAALADPSVAGGNFTLEFTGDDFPSRVFTLIDRWRRRFGVFYGDSGIFVRRKVFDRLGGFREWPVLEDYDFARRLVRAGKTVCLPQVVRVSSRRWDGRLLRTVAAWFFIQALYFLHVPPPWLARWYSPVREARRPRQSA